MNKRQSQLQVARRYRQLRQLWAKDGPNAIADRVRRAVAEWVSPKEIVMPVRREDVLAADLARPFQALNPKVTAGKPLAINWVTTPAAPGSGGHTTLYRIIRYLEEHGYVNRVYFYDVYGGDHSYYESIARSYYKFHGPVARVEEGMEDAHAVMATGWPTAYPVFNSCCSGKRFYFVQDFEPFFFPVGSFSLLAENTYRMGFHAITAGRWLAQKLSTEFGMAADAFDFGSDTSSYGRIAGSKRNGVVFYARPEAARRGFELGLMALEVLAARRPDLELHFYGNKMGKLPFRFFDHGRVTPAELNQIYNHCFAGLSLSLTNVSLVPHEMLAAGCIPVVNDAEHNRIVLNNSHVHYAAPNPIALAAELESIVMAPDFESISKASAASVHSGTWDDAGAAVDAILRRNIPSPPMRTAVGASLITH
jgi:hypothetical protein